MATTMLLPMFPAATLKLRAGLLCSRGVSVAVSTRALSLLFFFSISYAIWYTLAAMLEIAWRVGSRRKKEVVIVGIKGEWGCFFFCCKC